MSKVRIGSILILTIGFLIGWFVYTTEINPNSNFKFKLGLDLASGTHLTYRADTSSIESKGDISGAMSSLRQTVERRINIFGVTEPIVQVETGGFLGDKEAENRLIVELPGITDVTEAIELIGQTPLLEFKLLNNDPLLIEKITATSTPLEEKIVLQDRLYSATGLTGAQLEKATLVFDQVSGQALVSVRFNKEGKELLAKITSEKIGEVMAIFLDNELISGPVIRDKIINGEAQISGDFTPEEAKKLVQDLNFGALPLPVELIETQTIGASLGQNTLNKGIEALVWGLGAIFLFLIIFYRLPGLIAAVALTFYVAVMLFLFKFIPVTLTASGLAGFILSIGMAVDANVLIFERLKEELAEGSSIYEAIRESVKRAWTSIRDGNLSSLISAIVLFWLSGTSLVKGFALVFGIGVLVSMLTAVFVSQIFLLALSSRKIGSKLEFLFNKK